MIEEIGSIPWLANKAISLGAIQKSSELISLFNFIKDARLETIVEIGTAKGGVFYALCQLARDKATIVSIDFPGGDFGGGYSKKEMDQFKTYAKTPKQNLHFLRLDSHAASTKNDLVKILKGKKIDLLFIDGDHTYEGVKQDWRMYSPLVKNRGLVIFHDICHHPRVPKCQVEKLWKEIKPKHKIIEFIDEMDKSWGGIGIIKKS